MLGAEQAQIDQTRDPIEILIHWMFNTSKAKPKKIKIPAQEQDLQNLRQEITTIAANPSRYSIRNIEKVFADGDACKAFQDHIAHLLPPAVQSSPRLERYFRSSRAPIAGEDGGGSDSSSAYRRSCSITEDEASDTQSSITTRGGMDGDLSDDDLESARNREEEEIMDEEMINSTADKSTQTSGHEFTNGIVGERGSGPWLGIFPFTSQDTPDISKLENQLNNVRLDIQKEIDRKGLPVKWVYIGLPCGGSLHTFMEMIWEGPAGLCHAVRKKQDDMETGVTGKPTVQAFEGDKGHAEDHLSRCKPLISWRLEDEGPGVSYQIVIGNIAIRSMKREF
jgi:hypothetical protein